jgi:iron only hydrogenase large subunit-like protein
VKVGDLELGVAVASGLGNARALLEEVRSGKREVHFIEVMTCPGGCVNGGGQPLQANADAVRARMQSLYNIDRDAKVRTSHGNPYIKKLYEDYLGKPNGERSHHLLHTQYEKREVVL